MTDKPKKAQDKGPELMDDFGDEISQEVRALKQRIRQYVIYGVLHQSGDNHKIYSIKLNKEVAIEFTEFEESESGETLQVRRVARFPANKKFDCSLLILKQLELRAIQEGPEGMRKDYFDNSGEPRHENPLNIEIIAIKHSETDPASIKKHYVDGKMPSLLRS